MQFVACTYVHKIRIQYTCVGERAVCVCVRACVRVCVQ